MGSEATRSRHHRNAARVLPLPVGAAMSAWRPAATSRHPRSCTSVGSANDDRNQSRTGAEKRSRAVPTSNKVRPFRLCKQVFELTFTAVPNERRRMTVLLGGFAATQMLYVAARLRLADHLAHGPLTLAELAARSGARPEPLGRVLRALAAFGVFSTGDGEIANTPLSDCLRAGAPESVRDLALLYGEEHYHAMAELLEAVKRGGSAFEHAYRKPHFSYLASNPDAAQAYYEMSSAGLAR